MDRRKQTEGRAQAKRQTEKNAISRKHVQSSRNYEIEEAREFYWEHSVRPGGRGYQIPKSNCLEKGPCPELWSVVADAANLQERASKPVIRYL